MLVKKFDAHDRRNLLECYFPHNMWARYEIKKIEAQDNKSQDAKSQDNKDVKSQDTKLEESNSQGTNTQNASPQVNTSQVIRSEDMGWLGMSSEEIELLDWGYDEEYIESLEIRGDDNDFDDIRIYDPKLQDVIDEMICLENLPSYKKRKYLKKILHDCMWNGHCGSKEHPSDEFRSYSGSFVPTPITPIKSPMAPYKMDQMCKPVYNGQQSLLKSHYRPTTLLQTPPMSDDEEIKSNPTNVLKLLNEAIDECDIEEDSDLCDYFEDTDIKEEININDFEEDEEDTEVLPVVEPLKTFHAAESDHSYHKGKYCASGSAAFGIDTPSDSEEEIDVVNVIEKIQVNNKSVLSFPNNPSTRDRQQIQRRMATAISKKRMPPQALKTVMPVRKMSPPESPAIKKKPTATTARGGKRSKQCKPSTSSSYRRRHYGQSSDEEPETSEKRSLHNNMERQRRIDLRNAFEDLRVLVPEVSKKERAAKVVILREAASYCDFLSNTSKNNAKQFEDLKKKQEYLRRKLSMLRRNLAAKR
ncbi:transcriptional regulator Myc-A-like [Diorhabda sublineata]|uniref:transcriptional regulator Myc-A-like n=1 Tax=Diorhabda sublineata TaxID=1163346 RepID=UPI0024E179B8|nr:transcriptional regulator Myc-A-like [Diorhabda sublineata]XP_056641722.1 transcriptional regulator Myc-A-like [Diorhabda sublineata]